MPGKPAEGYDDEWALGGPPNQHLQPDSRALTSPVGAAGSMLTEESSAPLGGSAAAAEMQVVGRQFIWNTMALLTGDKLEKRCRELGIDIEGDLIFQSASGRRPRAADHELQRRVQEVERSIRESRLWLLAVLSAIASCSVLPLL